VSEHDGKVEGRREERSGLPGEYLSSFEATDAKELGLLNPSLEETFQHESADRRQLCFSDLVCVAVRLRNRDRGGR
jgi:hypothetical protein